MNKNKDLGIDEVFALAVQNHQEKKFEAAQNFYNLTLKINPNHVAALNNLGVVLKALDQREKAITCYEKAIVIDPNYSEAHNNLGTLLGDLKQYNKAISCYERAIEIKPNYADALSNLGVAYYELAQFQKAINCLEKAIKIKPGQSNTYFNIANIFMAIFDYQKAINFYEKIIEIDPNHARANNNIGVAFKHLGKPEKAVSAYEKAIEINPNFADAYNNLGVSYKELGEVQKAVSAYEKAIKINPDFLSPRINLTGIYVGELNDFEKAKNLSYEVLKLKLVSDPISNNMALFKLKHDVQQAKYLSSKNYKINGLDQFQTLGDEILNRRENKEDKNNYDKKILLNSDEIDTILPYHKSYHVYQTKKIIGKCINPNKNWLDIEYEYFNSSNQIMYIDDFLSDEALIELREFCLVSKVWHTEYPNKYLGAFSDSGFMSPIHLQIAKDLQQDLPKLFGPHKLGKLWGFKYDATLGKGINIHADFAFHNLNFWITPDEFNNNKNSGGLKVYDTPAPDNWTFKDYNGGDENKVYKFLKDNNANCVNVPYKFNRAVLFNSAYFHETDEIDFKDEYEGRRINMTYLFGTRLVKSEK
jgi:tetratricopeptide (TPR) repeat protein